MARAIRVFRKLGPKQLLATVARLALAFVFFAVLWLHTGLEHGISRLVTRTTALACGLIWKADDAQRHVVGGYNAKGHELQFTPPVEAARGVALVRLTTAGFFNILLPAILILALPGIAPGMRISRAFLSTFIMLGINLLYMPPCVPLLFVIESSEHPHPGVVMWFNTCMFGGLFVILPVAVAAFSLAAPIHLPRRLFRSKKGIGRQPGTGRNQPCPCGSGKKYKKCCGR